MQGRMEEWKKDKEEHMKSAKAAMFETGSEAFRKEAENMNKKTMEHFGKIIKSVASLSDRVNKSENAVDVVWKSLSTPAAVGQFSEIGLENTLKNYGLEIGRDFIMQYSVEGRDFSFKKAGCVSFSTGREYVGN